MIEGLRCHECGETDPVKLRPTLSRVFIDGYQAGHISSRKCHTCGHVWLHVPSEKDCTENESGPDGLSTAEN